MNGTETGLVHYYKFNEGTGGAINTGITDLPDVAGTSNGTLMGFTLSGTTSNWITSDVSIIAIGESPADSGSSSLTICEGDTVNFGGSNLFSTGVYTANYINVWGCDSVHTFNLTVIDRIHNNITISACEQYNFNGDVLTVSGMYDDTLEAATGCDSVVHLNLTVQTVNTAVTASGFTLTANTTGADYQWVDCNAGFAVIPGATSISFSPTQDGDYAVVVTESGCSDTSMCYPISGMGIFSHGYFPDVIVYPNPVSEILYIDAGTTKLAYQIKVTDLQGRTVFVMENAALPALVNMAGLSTGTYLVNLSSANGRMDFRVVKN